MNSLQARLNGVFEQRWLDIGLRGKMGMMVTVGLFGLLTISALTSISTATQVTQQVLSERVMLARMSAQALDSKLSYVESLLVIVAQNPELIDPQAGPAERDRSLLHFPILERGIILFNEEGEVLYSPEDAGAPEGLEAAVAAAGRLAGSPVNVAFLPGDSHRAVIAHPVFDATGERSGLVAALLDLTRPDIFPIAGTFDLGLSGVLEVVDSRGRTLYSTHPGEGLIRPEREADISRLFAEGALAVESCLGCADTLATGATNEVIAFAPLSEVPWGVVIRQTSGGVFAPVRRLTYRTFGLGMFSIIGALGLVWLTTNSVIDPVQYLTRAAGRVKAGDLSTPVEHPPKFHRRDEIGELFESFDAMRAHMKQSLDEIQVLNRDLDSRVQERTREARQAQVEAQAARDDLRAVIDAISDKLVVIRVDDRRVQLVNRAAQGEDDLVGRPCDEVFQLEKSCQPPNCACPIPQVLATGSTVRETYIYPGQGNGGQYIEVAASPMRDASGKITRVIELVRDVTEEKALKESLVRRNQQLSTINAIIATVSQTLNLEEILETALDEVLRLTDIDVGALYLLDENQESLKLVAYRGLSPDEANLAAQKGMLDSSCGDVLGREQDLVVAGLEEKGARRAGSPQGEKASTLVHIPLLFKGKPLGGMCVGISVQEGVKGEDKDLLSAIGSQIAVAVENARLYAQVQQKEQISRELFKKSIKAQEEERKRIARELHDDTSEALRALLAASEEGLEIEDRDQLKARLAGMGELAASATSSLHKIIFDLRPAMLDRLGLVPALRSFAASRLEDKGIQVSVRERVREADGATVREANDELGVDQPAPSGKGEPSAGGEGMDELELVSRRMLPEVETALFRVIQEAITNIARHAEARSVCLQFDYSPDSTEVLIEDDGIGFDLSSLTLTPDDPRGLGLLGMQERLELLGGELEIRAAPGEGTRIKIRVPRHEMPGEG